MNLLGRDVRSLQRAGQHVLRPLWECDATIRYRLLCDNVLVVEPPWRLHQEVAQQMQNCFIHTLSQLRDHTLGFHSFDLDGRI